jgi:hypothetical protein
MRFEKFIWKRIHMKKCKNRTISVVALEYRLRPVPVLAPDPSVAPTKEASHNPEPTKCKNENIIVKS